MEDKTLAGTAVVAKTQLSRRCPLRATCLRSVLCARMEGLASAPSPPLASPLPPPCVSLADFSRALLVTQTELAARAQRASSTPRHLSSSPLLAAACALRSATPPSALAAPLSPLSHLLCSASPSQWRRISCTRRREIKLSAHSNASLPRSGKTSNPTGRERKRRTPAQRIRATRMRLTL